VQRYCFFPNHQNFSGKIFSFQVYFFHFLIKVKPKTAYTLLYYIEY
jgi:hypothetical protein